MLLHEIVADGGFPLIYILFFSLQYLSVVIVVSGMLMTLWSEFYKIYVENASLQIPFIKEEKKPLRNLSISFLDTNMWSENFLFVTNQTNHHQRPQSLISVGFDLIYNRSCRKRLIMFSNFIQKHNILSFWSTRKLILFLKTDLSSW